MAIRIALLSWDASRAAYNGEIPLRFAELAEAWRKLGHEVHVFTRMAVGQPRYECVDAVHYHHCSFDPDPDFLTYVGRMRDAFFDRLQEVEQATGRAFDVIYGHDRLCAQVIGRRRPAGPVAC